MGSSGHDAGGNEDAMQREILAAWNDLSSQSGCPEVPLLQAAVSGVLPEDVGTSVLRHVEKCQICQSLARDLQAVDDAPPREEELRRVWNRMEAAIRPGAATEPAVRRAGTWRFWLKPWQIAAIAAAVLAILVVPSLLRRRPEPSASAGPTQPAPVPAKPALALEKPPILLPASALMVWRGAPDSDRAQWTELQVALRSYQSSDYASAAEQLRRVATTHPGMVEAWFYLGVSELFLGQNQQAAADLESGRKIAQPALDAEMKWYSAIADERIGRVSDERLLLEELCRGSSKYSVPACRSINQ